MSAELIAMFAMFLTMIIGFLSLLFMLGQMNHQMNSRFDSLRQEFKSEISDLRAEIKSEISDLRAEIKAEISDLRAEFKADLNTLELKLNTLLMGLFNRQYLPAEQSKPKQDKQA